MTCCAAVAGGSIDLAHANAMAEELRLATMTAPDGLKTLRFSVPGMKCGGCIAGIEKAVNAVPGILTARANLTARAVSVTWRGTATEPTAIRAALARAGFDATVLDPDDADAEDARECRDLVTRMGVAGFASANVMLLSVSVWAGAGDATRDLLHWISALIALPTVVYAGRPFFISALRGLRAGRLNMDAPISLAVILAALVSLSQVIRGGEEAYFDAAVMLLFLLLVGRWLDVTMRAKARRSASALARMSPRGAWVVDAAGERRYRAADALRAGDLVAVDAGMRIPVDGTVTEGRGTLDASLVTGESTPVAVAPGARVEAGTMTLDAGLTIRATGVGEGTTLAEIMRLCAAAEDRKSRLARLADRAAAIYAPLVHLIALATLIGWMVAGAGFERAMLAAVAVLIVTCPCALGLAAPMAQAVASGRLFRAGVMLKDGAALERLALVDRAVFDKTGVLTIGTPRPTGGLPDGAALSRLAALATRSTHPLAQALAGHAAARATLPVSDIRETPGAGIEGTVNGRRIRLGSASFCGTTEDIADDALACWYVDGDARPRRLTFADSLRPDTAATVAALERAGIDVEILSGDRSAAVERSARETGIGSARAGMRPEDKIDRVESLTAQGHRVLMVGDGINDAPALSAATVSMAPASGSDIGRAAADLVFTGASLGAVTTAWRIARRTRTVILQNFALAAAYNTIAIPLAVLGHAGPLVAAIAMSSSSLLVTLNALRLNTGADT